MSKRLITQMEDEGGRIFRSDNRTRRDKDREREGERSIGVADTEVCQRCTKVLGVGKLLSPIY